jgi:hypothetical protein
MIAIGFTIPEAGAPPTGATALANLGAVFSNAI